MASHDKKISLISDILKDEYVDPFVFIIMDDIDPLTQTERELEREFECLNQILLAQAERELEREAGYDDLPF